MYDRDGLDKDGADEVCETNVEQDLHDNIWVSFCRAGKMAV